MNESYNSGIAFIFEGDTEKVFYSVLLNHFLKKHPEYQLQKQEDEKTGEFNYILFSDNNCVLIKQNVVGTVSQLTNSGAWFQNRCYKVYKKMLWTVFLCYDTDSHSNDISKFHEGDWKNLRKSIEKNRGCTIIDLASQADIEDTMLLDFNGVLKYIGLPDDTPFPSGTKGKGKGKMKQLFRKKGRGFAYHEGERARPLIETLDMDKIMLSSPIPFSEIESKGFL